MDVEAIAAPAQAPFVGRERQLGLLAGRLARARSGTPAVIQVHGESGMGKSALLARVIAGLAHDEDVVLRGAGDEAESALHLGVVGQLVAGVSPVPARLADLLTEPGELNHLAAGRGLLELLGDLQDHGPVLLVVDDAHWADSASLHALAFCMRRLRADRVLALFAARTDELERLPHGLTSLAQEPTGATIPITGLAPAELAELAGALEAGRLSPHAAERLAHHTRGSPLLAGALLQELGASALSSHETLETLAPRSFSSVVLARLAACGAAGRELALAASVLGLRWPLAVATRLAAVEDPLAAIDEARQARLITIEPTAHALPLGSFSHPLVRAVLYQELALGRRAALHRAAAGLVEDARDALRHRVEAEIGPNAALADELATAARHDADAGSWATAAQDHLWAARVTEQLERREQHLLDAAMCLLRAGDIARARGIVDPAASFGDCALLHLVRGYLAWADGSLPAAEQELRAAWQLAVDAHEGELAARAADVLASLCVPLGRGEDVRGWARRSLEAHPRPLAGAKRRSLLLVGYGISGRAAEGLAEAARLELDWADAREADGLMGRGNLRLWSDDPAGAREDLRPVVETCLRDGPLEIGMVAAVHLADAEWRLGAWDDALIHAEAAVNAAADVLHGWFVAEAHAMAALPLATRGHWEAAEACVRRAVHAARRVGLGLGTLWTVVTRGRLADARGDPERVVRALMPLAQVPGRDGADHPGMHSWREPLGAALVALGRLEEAAEHATVLERQAQQLPLRSAGGRALRLRGLIAAAAGGYDEAIPLLESALADFEPLPQPFDRALIAADLGACLRRAGRRRAAADRLYEAHATLAGLGAAPYLARVDRELAACGLHPARTATDTGSRLTPAELAVARLVAEGKSNKEVASELVLSAKTIEHHLTRIYHKLEVRSRTQLSVRLSEH